MLSRVRKTENFRNRVESSRHEPSTSEVRRSASQSGFVARMSSLKRSRRNKEADSIDVDDRTGNNLLDDFLECITESKIIQAFHCDAIMDHKRSFKDGDEDGDTQPHKGVKASANSDVMYFFTSAQDSDPSQDDVRLCLGDDLKKAQDHSQRQAGDLP
ncbi:hypothetical protein Tco_1049851 [Tanacetum coccineum]